MIDKGILKLQARVDPFRLSHKISAIVGVNLKERDREEKMKQIAEIPCVTSVWNATGRYDLFFEIMVDSLADLNDVLFGKDLKRTGIGVDYAFDGWGGRKKPFDKRNKGS